MSFNIGNQSGGVINNVAGNQRVEGGQQGTQVTRQDAASAAASLHELLASLRLPALSEAERAQVDQDAAVVDEEMASSHPSAQEVSTRLERLTSVLTAAGAFVGAGAGLLGPLTTIAQWLGPLGSTVLRALPVG